MADLTMSIHEKLRSLPDDRNFGDALKALIKEALQSKWAVGFRDRGLGYGDYAVIMKDSEDVIVTCPYLKVAEHLVATHNAAPETARQRDELLEAVNKTLNWLSSFSMPPTATIKEKQEAMEWLETVIANTEDKP